ncbi:ribosome biogenesis protein YTM1 [Striga asiatica]|uniref:Ribosome biogenesis protein YTM1 n=1 Tax=Striga asiatica TaxID=4170 RepID=A0A5A7P4G9_STRAF|nr:ribosome biogenesis protein YTM1 [Striga asiatica]
MAFFSTFHTQLNQLNILKSIGAKFNQAYFSSKKAPALDAEDDDINRESPVATLASPVAPPLDLNLWLEKSNEVMLVVQSLGNGSSCYSLVSTKRDSFKVVVKDDMSSLSALLKSQNCNPELYAKPHAYQYNIFIC